MNTHFPDYDCEMPVVTGFNDSSWHQDRCPSLMLEYGDYKIILWCDYADKSKRELQDEGKQYTLQFLCNDVEFRTEIDYDTLPDDLTRVALEELYTHWVKSQNLWDDEDDNECLGLLLSGNTTEAQYAWLEEFYVRWEDLC